MTSKRTKIVCTIGPSTWDQEVMRKMIEAGMNCARVNGAFADPEELDKVKSLVKAISNDVALMVDVKGPEIRLNKFSQQIPLSVGQEIIIGNNESSQIYPSNYQNLYSLLNPGQKIVVGDGDVEMIVKDIKGEDIYCEVTYGQALKPGKAINLPGANIATEVLTEKDKQNLRHAIDTGWDFVSASFIQSAEAAKEVKAFIGQSTIKLIAKIEDQKGVDNIDSILENVDGIMIARGGLGVELGLEKVPVIQRYLTQKCNDAGKPVITATQMLESMSQSPRPTRAEVNDVATAIMLGTDAVMLSAESSAGMYPVESVKTLTSIASIIEEAVETKIVSAKTIGFVETRAIAKAAAQMCIEMQDEISKVVVVSRSGKTAQLIGRHTIKQPIYLFAKYEHFARQASLYKGITKSFVYSDSEMDRETAIEKIKSKVVELGIATFGEKILLICKPPLDVEEDFFPSIFQITKI